MKRKIGGFTLVELMIVIAIMTILSAIAVPNFMTALPSYRLKSASRDLYSFMQRAKMNAVTERQRWGIVFNPGANSFSLCVEAPVAGADPDWLTLASINCIETVNLGGYGSGIGYGFGNAGLPGGLTADGLEPAPENLVTYANSSNVVIFTPRGLITSSDPSGAALPSANGPEGAGFVHLTNIRADAFAVGTNTTGSIVIRRWMGTGAVPQWQ